MSKCRTLFISIGSGVHPLACRDTGLSALQLFQAYISPAGALILLVNGLCGCKNVPSYFLPTKIMKASLSLALLHYLTLQLQTTDLAAALVRSCWPQPPQPCYWPLAVARPPLGPLLPAALKDTMETSQIQHCCIAKLRTEPINWRAHRLSGNVLARVGGQPEQCVFFADNEVTNLLWRGILQSAWPADRTLLSVEESGKLLNKGGFGCMYSTSQWSNQGRSSAGNSLTAKAALSTAVSRMNLLGSW